MDPETKEYRPNAIAILDENNTIMYAEPIRLEDGTTPVFLSGDTLEASLTLRFE